MAVKKKKNAIDLDKDFFQHWVSGQIKKGRW